MNVQEVIKKILEQPVIIHAQKKGEPAKPYIPPLPKESIIPERKLDPEPLQVPTNPIKPIEPKITKFQANKVSAGYIKPSIYESALKIIGMGINLLVTGPAGCGKSRMVEEISREIGKEFFTISFAGGLRYAQVFGSTHLENGNSRWIPGPLLEAIQKPCVILLDEIFSADADVLLGLNAILEPNSRSILTPIGKIEVNPDCIFVAAANTIGRVNSRQYTGAQRTDDSLLDRFVTLAMDYDVRIEEKIIAPHANGTSKALIQKIAQFRMALKENNIQFDASTRRLIAAAKLTGQGIDLEMAWKLAFTNNLSDAERSKVN